MGRTLHPVATAPGSVFVLRSGCACNRTPNQGLLKKRSPSKKAWMGFESWKVAGLENKPETKTDLTRNLARERLIKPHISGDAGIRQSGQDLAGKSARENCTESVQLTEAIRIADPKIPCRQRIG